MASNQPYEVDCIPQSSVTADLFFTPHHKAGLQDYTARSGVAGISEIAVTIASYRVSSLSCKGK